MARKRKKTKSIAKPLIIIASIALLNFSGISYASWNDSLNLSTSLTTGNIDPSFCKNNFHIDAIDPNRDVGELTITFDDDHTMNIEGVVDKNYKAFLHYCLINKGTIPVKFDQGAFENSDGSEAVTLEMTEGNKKIKVNNNENVYRNYNHDGLKLQLNQQSGILLPMDYFYSETGNQKLHIQSDEKGTYNFEIELLFKQFTK